LTNRPVLIIVISALVTVILLHVGCRKLREDKINPKRFVSETQHSNQGTGNQIIPSPGKKSTVEMPIGAGYSVISATGELSLSTEEWGAATGEDAGATEEAQHATKELVYVRNQATIFQEPDPKSTGMEIVKVGSALLLMPDTVATAEWLHVNTGKFEGYVNQASICPNQFCIIKKRNGVANIFLGEKIIHVPQIQLEVNNIYPQEIRELRIAARFYYHDEIVGEDEGYVAAVTLGIPTLRPGQSKLLYLRPYFNMPKAEVLSPRNPVEVDILCAMERFNYVPCGKFEIDHMFY